MSVAENESSIRLINGIKEINLKNCDVKDAGNVVSGGVKDAGPGGDSGKEKPSGKSNNQPEEVKDWTEEVKDGIDPHPVGHPREEGNDDDDEEPGSSDESDEEDSSSEDEIRAPFELMGEFLQCVREADWENASKLCKMILIYEPNNPEALQFQKVIAEKAQIEEELAQMSSSSEEDEESSEEEENEEEEEGSQNESDHENDKDDDSSDDSDERPSSTLKNKLIFPHEPIWKP